MLNRLHKATDERDKGFTLIELLVVIIIIGILAAVAIPLYLNQREKGVDSGVKSDLKNAATAAESFATDNPKATVFTATDMTDNGFMLTTDNELQVTGGPAQGYCIRGTNDAGSFDAGEYYWYDSVDGGLLEGSPTTSKAGGACAVANPVWVTLS